MPDFRFRCHECGAEYGEDEVRTVCPACAGKQERGASTRGVLEVEFDEVPDRWPDAAPGSREFDAAFLPVDASLLPPIGVGGTPLLEAARLRKLLAMPRLWLKDDGRNPSGSTKDRASALVVAKAAEYGIETVATASSGNAAAALATVAAAAGTRAVVLVPESAPDAKLVQMLACGATVIPVAGSYDDAFELCQEACEKFGWYNRNTANNPFTIEGKKTLALEIGARLTGAEAGSGGPDVVLVPTGDGVILAGVAKGFADLVRGGLLERMPRLIAVQPEGSAAIVNAWRDGADDVSAIPDAASVADSLVVQAPRNARLCLKRIRESGGAAVAAADGAIVDSIALLASETGVFAEPAAAAALAGLLVARGEGLVDRDERVVLLITGTGLKDIPAATRAVARPEPIEPELEAVARRLEGGS